jgi:hypothetical protein
MQIPRRLRDRLSDELLVNRPCFAAGFARELRQVSIAVTTRVIAQAFEDGVATTRKLTPATAEAYVRTHFWHAHYLPFVRG